MELFPYPSKRSKSVNEDKTGLQSRSKGTIFRKVGSIAALLAITVIGTSSAIGSSAANLSSGGFHIKAVNDTDNGFVGIYPKIRNGSGESPAPNPEPEPTEDPVPEVEPTSADCFKHVTISGGVSITDYYDYRSNVSTNEACPRDVVIPAAIDGASVVNLADQAFFNNRLTSAKIPSSVTAIGMHVFGTNQLKEIVIPNSVTSIAASAFGNNKLTSVTLSNTLKSMGDYTFSGNQLTSVYIPDSMESIGRQAFYTNPGLTDVSIKRGPIALGEKAFPTGAKITYRD